MRTIYKTKEVVPLIFDYYPDTYVINLYDEVHWSNANSTTYWDTQTEINKRFSTYDQTIFNNFPIKNGNLYMGRGIMYFSSSKAVIYREDGELRGAQTTIWSVSPGKQTIINKFFKHYGIKLKDVIKLEHDAFVKKFIFPIKFGINDLHPNVQKTISSEFLRQQRWLTEEIPVSTEEAVEVL